MQEIEHETGHVVDQEGTAVAPIGVPAPGTAVQPAVEAGQVMNPLDVPVQHFGQMMANRKENYDQLREYLREHLVPGLDFDRIHIANKDKCPKPYQCSYEQNPYHYSKHQLLDPGADKILGVLGLGVKYDGVDQYRNASLKGVKIVDVILRAYIFNAQQVTICEGGGAASRKPDSWDDLSNTIKKAQKRARVDAVKRLPSVSALFDGDFFESIIGPEERNSFRPQPSREAGEGAPPNQGPGKLLEFMPFSKHKGKRFTELEINFLHWIVHHIKDKPDVYYSAVTEIERRNLQDDTVETAVPKQAPPPRSAQEGFTEKQVDESWGESAFSDLDNGPPADDGPPVDSYF